MMQWRSEGERADRSGRHSGGGGKIGVIRAKMGTIRGHQTSDDFWGRQNCIPPRAPITDAKPLAECIVVVIR